MTIEIRYFSGYIRNWKSLCVELGIDPSLSRAEREQEILKQAYAKWQLDMMSHIFGAFAFGLYDGEADKLFVIRDQVGQKQMFYAVCGGELLYSGDINEISRDTRFEKKLNMRMLQQYLFYGYPIGGETFYEGIFKLTPGCYVEWDGKTAEVRRYFKPNFEPDRSKTVEQWAKEIENVVDEILDEERQDAEVPYKESFLSGGVDSSYLLAASDAACANTIGYDEKSFNESNLARDTADALNKPFRVKLLGPQEYFDRVETTIDKLGQPLGDASAVAFSLGCKAVKEFADVVYSGEGIDEFFGGYMAHQRHIPEEWTYLTCSHIMTEDYVKELMLDYDPAVKAADPIAPLWAELKDKEELAQKLTVDISFWLEGDIYLNTDRTSTACGIELHTPFSDLRLFDVARRIPSEYQFRNGQNKYSFRLAASSRLPEESAFRKKVGFPVPVREWLCDEKYNKPVEEKLFGETSQRFFDQEVVRKLWTDYLDNNMALWNRVYAVYVFLVWYDINFK